jgi:ABC-2 type transport system ATP-binding protein
MRSVVVVKDLVKHYGRIKAIDGISFSIYENEIFGMVGPNGAGKTTTIECIEGLKKPDTGVIEVLGLNPATNRERIYERIGVQLQETSFQDRIKIYEICELFVSFYKRPLSYIELLKRFDLYEFKNNFVMKLSGGQKQKLSIILALISNPEIIFLDELTTGLDPKARRGMWQSMKELRNEGRTIFLTTHYMEEAEELCDRVAIVDNGKIIALGTPEELIERSEIENTITFETKNIAIEALKKVKGVHQATFVNGEVKILGLGEDLLKDVVEFLYSNKIYFKNLRTKQPNLEDTFLKFTGKEYTGGNNESFN